jgi:two-component system response regulator RegA
MSDSTRRLLIIDDDESYREVLARSLARKGFSTCCAADMESALACCRTQRPEYLLLDLNLAGQSGLNLIKPLLAIVPEARIVVLTGYASIQTAVGALKLGAGHYLPKPASLADILKALNEDCIDMADEPASSRLSVPHMEWEYIQRTLAEHDGNIAATARALNMHRRTLQRKLAKKRPVSPPPA